MADNLGQAGSAGAMLLARYQGERPEAPDWFTQAVNTPYEEHFLEVDGAAIRYQTWGDKGKPGLFLVHGNAAHAHWYDFIAPSFCEDYYVVAMTFSGMGDSGWREAYSFEQFTAEQVAVCEDAGLFEDGRKPVLMAHSFGGSITLHTAARNSEKFAGLIIVDSRLLRPDEVARSMARSRPHRAYASLGDALARFRLEPIQPCENHYLVDYVARHSLKQVESADGQTGWTWKFDPKMLNDFDFSFIKQRVLAQIDCPITMIRGRNSSDVTDDLWAYMRAQREDMDMFIIEDAHHHVMLDQPLALIEHMKSALNTWQY